MDRSPSPHHLESLNQEDKAASTAGEGAEGSEQAPPPTSLLDLPDELLVNVFGQVHAGDHSSEYGIPTGRIARPIRKLALNKRLYTLVRPFWLREMRTPTASYEVEALAARLLAVPTSLPQIAFLTIAVDTRYPSVGAHFIRLLPQLTSINLYTEPHHRSGYEDYIDESIPFVVSEALKTLRNLVSLTVSSVSSFDDDTFTLREELPSLRELDVHEYSLMHQLLQCTAVPLRSLTVRSAWASGFDAPWHTLQELHLRPKEGHLEEPEELIEEISQWVKQEGSLPLRQLTFDFPCLASPPPEHPDRFHLTHLQSVLRLLQHSNLERLEFGKVDNFVWHPCDVHLSGVKHLKLGGTLPFHEPSNIPTLLSLLSHFPSLTRLSISRSFDTQHYFSETRRISVTRAGRVELYKVLNPFLEALKKKTTVLEVRYRPEWETHSREMRWVRRRVEEDFEGDEWTLKEA